MSGHEKNVYSQCIFTHIPLVIMSVQPGQCSYLLSQGFCKRQACHIEDNRPLCEQHREIIRRSGPCTICYEDMSDPHLRIKMPCCKQWFHKSCLQQATDRGIDTCPMCR